MRTEADLQVAIGESIRHGEIVRLAVDDPQEALDTIDTNECVRDLDYVKTPTHIDVWGKRCGEDFRIYILGDAR